MIYVLVPNRKVKFTHAAFGAATAVGLFWVIRKIFSLLILSNATYKTLYGALAVIPMFLIWMYLVWAAVIFGAVVTAAIDEYLRTKALNRTETKSEQK